MIHSLQAAQAEDAVTGTTRQSSKSAFCIVLSNALNEYKSYETRPVKFELITFTHFSRYISYRKQKETGNYLSKSSYEGM